MKARASEEDAAYMNGDESEDEDDWAAPARKSGKAKAPRSAAGKAACGAGRTRPTNNQLQYKACFRWQHDSMKLSSTAGLLLETDPCSSVTSCFLQVLQVLHNAEQLKIFGPKKNVLQSLSTNTRRTKVVELSSGTHRVPDELRKHYLSDGEGGQYSTNLDRNRYGNDDNYLFTVIRYDLEFLGWCPCMVDVEIIDAKAGNSSTLVQCGAEACVCSDKGQHVSNVKASPISDLAATGSGEMANMGYRQPAATGAMQAKVQNLKVDSAGGPSAFNGFSKPPSPRVPSPQTKRARKGGDSPKHSNSGVSALFDVLVMAATGEGAEGAAAGSGGASEPPVTSAFNVMDPAGGAPLGAEALLNLAAPAAAQQDAGAPGGNMDVVGTSGANLPPQLGSRFTAAAADLNGIAANGVGQEGGASVRRPRAPPVKTRSRLWSALSQGELDSLQNALDAYVKTEDEIVSKPFGTLADPLSPGSGGAAADPPVRTRRRKPPRGNSSFLLLAADSMGGFSGLSKLGLSLGFKETSDDNLKEESSKPGSSMGLEEEEGGECGAEDKGDGAEDDGAPNGQRRRHVRHVPRQFSSVNVTARAGAAEIKRMASELEALREANRNLKEASKNGTNRNGTNGSSSGHLFALEQQLLEVRSEVQALLKRCQAAEEREAANLERARQAEERSTALTMELAKSRAEVNILMSKLVGVNVGVSSLGSMPQGMMGSSASSLAAALRGSSADQQHQSGKASYGGLSNGGLDSLSLSAQLQQLQQQQQQQQLQQSALANQQRSSGSGMSAQTSASVMALLGKGGLGFGSMTGGGAGADQGLGGSALGGTFQVPGQRHAATTPTVPAVGGGGLGDARLD